MSKKMDITHWQKVTNRQKQKDLLDIKSVLCLSIHDRWSKRSTIFVCVCACVCLLQLATKTTSVSSRSSFAVFEPLTDNQIMSKVNDINIIAK